MKTPQILLSLFLFSLICAGCARYEFRWVRQLEGKWNISNYLVTQIDTGGNLTTLIDQNDAGFYEFAEAEINGLQLEGQFEFVKTLTLNGSTQSVQGGGTVDEEGGRVIFYGGNCIQCDTFYTMVEERKNHKVWSRFAPDPSGLFTTHLQVTIDRE